MRLKPHERQAQIIAAVLAEYGNRGCDLLYATRNDCAEIAGCAPSLIAYHFSDMPSLRYAVVAEGLRKDPPQLAYLGEVLGVTRE